MSSHCFHRQMHRWWRRATQSSAASSWHRPDGRSGSTWTCHLIQSPSGTSPPPPGEKVKRQRQHIQLEWPHHLQETIKYTHCYTAVFDTRGEFQDKEIWFAKSALPKKQQQEENNNPQRPVLSWDQIWCPHSRECEWAEDLSKLVPERVKLQVSFSAPLWAFR